MAKVSRALGGITGRHLRTINTELVHQRIHDGIFFTATAYDAALASAGILQLLTQIPAGQSAHLRIFGSAGGEALGELFENTTFSDAGTAATVQNRNRFSANVSPITITTGPTITSPGDLLVQELVGAKFGGSLGTFEEWILAPGNYLARLTNIAPQTQAVALQLDFYDGRTTVR